MSAILKLSPLYAFLGAFGIVIGLSIRLDALKPIGLAWYIPVAFGAFLLATMGLVVYSEWKAVETELEVPA